MSFFEKLRKNKTETPKVEEAKDEPQVSSVQSPSEKVQIVQARQVESQNDTLKIQTVRCPDAVDGKLQLRISPCANNVNVQLFRLFHGQRDSFRVLNTHQTVKYESKYIDVSAQIPQEAAGQMVYVCVTQYDVLQNILRRQLRLLTKVPLKFKMLGKISLQCKLFDFNEYSVASAYLNADEQQLEITIAASHFVIRIKSEDVRICELSEASMRPYVVQQDLRLQEFSYIMLQHYLDFSILQTNFTQLFDRPDQQDEFTKIAQRTKENLVL